MGDRLRFEPPRERLHDSRIPIESHPPMPLQ
jgi:hypothetical protein